MTKLKRVGFYRNCGAASIITSKLVFDINFFRGGGVGGGGVHWFVDNVTQSKVI